MKQVFRFSLPVLAIFAVVACGNNNETATAKEEHGHTTAEAHDHEAMENKEQASETQSGSVRIKDDNLNAVYQHYVHLTKALTNSDAAEAKVAANAIEAGAKQMQGGSAIVSAASKIVTSSDIEAQRKAYEDLSKEVMSKVKSAGVENGELYIQHCPMAFNDKGASWLSSEKEIRNPYFGKKMLTCGEVKETIK